MQTSSLCLIFNESCFIDRLFFFSAEFLKIGAITVNRRSLPYRCNLPASFPGKIVRKSIETENNNNGTEYICDEIRSESVSLRYSTHCSVCIEYVYRYKRYSILLKNERIGGKSSENP